MKLMKRSGIYKAANATFNPKTIEAVSYDWWSFVKVIKGQVIFNAYFYSQSTSKHQLKVRGVMRDLGIKIDREVSFKTGLQDVSSLRDLNRIQKNQDAINLSAANMKRLWRNKQAREKRAAAKAAKQALVTHAAHESQDAQIVTLRIIQGGAV